MELLVVNPVVCGDKMGEACRELDATEELLTVEGGIAERCVCEEALLWAGPERERAGWGVREDITGVLVLEEEAVLPWADWEFGGDMVQIVG